MKFESQCDPNPFENGDAAAPGQPQAAAFPKAFSARSLDKVFSQQGFFRRCGFRGAIGGFRRPPCLAAVVGGKSGPCESGFRAGAEPKRGRKITRPR